VLAIENPLFAPVSSLARAIYGLARWDLLPFKGMLIALCGMNIWQNETEITLQLA
jgi:hypothetical protein